MGLNFSKDPQQTEKQRGSLKEMRTHRPEVPSKVKSGAIKFMKVQSGNLPSGGAAVPIKQGCSPAAGPGETREISPRVRWAGGEYGLLSQSLFSIGPQYRTGDLRCIASPYALPQQVRGLCGKTMLITLRSAPRSPVAAQRGVHGGVHWGGRNSSLCLAGCSWRYQPLAAK